MLWLIIVAFVVGFFIDVFGEGLYLKRHENESATHHFSPASYGHGKGAENEFNTLIECANSSLGCRIGSFLHGDVRFVVVPRAPASLLPIPPLVEAGASLYSHFFGAS